MRLTSPVTRTLNTLKSNETFLNFGQHLISLSVKLLQDRIETILSVLTFFQSFPDADADADADGSQDKWFLFDVRSLLRPTNWIVIHAAYRVLSLSLSLSLSLLNSLSLSLSLS